MLRLLILADDLSGAADCGVSCIAAGLDTVVALEGTADGIEADIVALDADTRAMAPDAESALLAHGWPGNVREVQNRVRRALTLATGDAITADDLGFGSGDAARVDDLPLERAQIEAALLNASGSVSRAAAALGLSRQSLYRRMEKLGIVMEKRIRGN